MPVPRPPFAPLVSVTVATTTTLTGIKCKRARELFYVVLVVVITPPPPLVVVVVPWLIDVDVLHSIILYFFFQANCMPCFKFCVFPPVYLEKAAFCDRIAA